MSPHTDEQIHVLIVDDDAALLDTIGIFLEGTGEIRTILACGGGEALQRMESEHFDVCVSDLEMPGMNGLSLLEEIRCRGMDLPCVLMTGNGHGSVIEQAHLAGADCIIRKNGEGCSFFQELIDVILTATGREENGHLLPEDRKGRRLSVHA